MAKKKPQPILVLDLKKSVPGLIIQSKTFVLNVTGNPLSFSTLDPVGAIVGTDIDNLQGAETALENGTGKMGPRTTALDKVWEDLNNWGGQVQGLVRKLSSYTDQVNLIHLFGAKVKVNGKWVKPPFDVVNTSAGVATLIKKKVPGAVNEYQVSYDMGVTWVGLVSTTLNEIPVAGFAIGATPFFRTRANMGLVEGTWLVISIIITK